MMEQYTVLEERLDHAVPLRLSRRSGERTSTMAGNMLHENAIQRRASVSETLFTLIPFLTRVGLPKIGHRYAVPEQIPSMLPL